MNNLILILNLAANLNATPMTPRVQTCSWPNVCAEQPATLAGVSTCQWPNTCAQQPVTVAQVSTCQWPHTCSNKA